MESKEEVFSSRDGAVPCAGKAKRAFFYRKTGVEDERYEAFRAGQKATSVKNASALTNALVSADAFPDGGAVPRRSGEEWLPSPGSSQGVHRS